MSLFTKNVLDTIHYFDVLKSDKSMSSHGLESRSPYLDKEFTKMYRLSKRRYSKTFYSDFF